MPQFADTRFKDALFRYRKDGNYPVVYREVPKMTANKMR